MDVLGTAFLTDRDEAHFHRCRLELSSKPHNFVALAGAGASRDVGYPDWGELLDHMHDMANRKGRDLPDALRVMADGPVRASIYKKIIDSDHEYHELIRTCFRARPVPKNSLVRDILDLPLKYFLTTNYDPSLQKAEQQRAWKSHGQKGRKPACRVYDWTHEPDVERLLAALKTESSHDMEARRFVHLHGTTRRPDSIVLTERDYLDRYVKSQQLAKRLTALMSYSKRMICIGFSLNDLDVMEVFRQLHSLGGEVATHYALLAAPRKLQEADARRQLLQEKYGIIAIFYRLRRKPGRHANLNRLVRHLGVPTTEHESAKRQARAPSRIQKKPPTQKEISQRLQARTGSDDPCKGVFGGLAAVGGYELKATVRPSSDPYWYQIFLSIITVDKRKPLKGSVKLYLHPSFPKPVMTAVARNGRATLRVWAWGAFTVGAYLERERVTLELDLATIDAPADFRSR
jgi:NAD-dependent SIR2 family protein deacetylase